MGYSAKSTLPVLREKCGCASMRISCHSLLKCVENHTLLPSYWGRKYIDNYSNTGSGIPAYLGLFVSCLSDRLVDIVSDLPLLVNPSLSEVWLSLLYFSVAF